MQVYAGVVGYTDRPLHYMFHLSREQGSIRLVYPFWIFKNGNSVTLLDMGFTAEAAHERHVGEFVDPIETLGRLGIAPADVERIIISHLHFDHFCAPQRFPNARFLIQRADVDYYPGEIAEQPFRRTADRPSVEQLGALRAAGRLETLDGDTTIDGDLMVHHVGGHSPGMQVTVLRSASRPYVFACDASHFYRNLESRTPTALIYSYADYQRGFDVIAKVTGRDGVWFAGHDPAILDRLEPAGERIFRLAL
jgi:glyoxylase-like metal-dependent hydrolase (beta-lactamase superfamily II)